VSRSFYLAEQKSRLEMLSLKKSRKRQKKILDMNEFLISHIASNIHIYLVSFGEGLVMLAINYSLL
jgi:hypothetical protein